MSPVPDHYRGVWARTLLETPQQRDESTFVRWLQTSLWHADLRIPVTVPEIGTQHQLAGQQGFCGVTQVERQADGEVCTWQRRLDFQPARAEVDAGVMVFETSERVIETGVHAPYLEIWERLPDSTGRFIALAGLDEAGGDTRERFLVAGRYAMHVRPRRLAWPADTSAGQTLLEVMDRHPGMAQALLDFEISFGTLEGGDWTIEQSTLPALTGACMPFAVARVNGTCATVGSPGLGEQWQVLEWSGQEAPV
ncbi:hypothetical protein [Rhodoferax sp.]|uniref:hypothetical protein n=1 Tax=Rhodoferax sp. TaxID=50421 RepID=UPI00273657EB|nr:hypothetical protein [Rhodoferax sp.]MDP3190968.1 hypothetical protein [Rhodoferax sp.]MDP3336303.1 hypothetical protein [Rhodoferax sp.]